MLFGKGPLFAPSRPLEALPERGHVGRFPADLGGVCLKAPVGNSGVGDLGSYGKQIVQFYTQSKTSSAAGSTTRP